MEPGWLLLGITHMERMEAHPDSMQNNYVLVHTEHTRARSEPCRCSKVLLAYLVVAIVVVSSAGGIVAFLVFTGNGAVCQEVSSRKIITGPLKDRNDVGEYDIFTAEKTATYLIYGEVKCTEHTEDFIVLKQSWKGESAQVIQSKKHRYSDARIVEEVKVMQESRVYLLFNIDTPECSSEFRVYEL